MCKHCECSVEHICLRCRDEIDNIENWDEPLIFENAFCFNRNPSSQRCSCVYENEDDWDTRALIECEYCINKRQKKIQEEKDKRIINKRINFERKRHKKCLKIKFMKLLKDNKAKIDKNATMKNLVNGMMNIFKHSSDWSTFEQILIDTNIDNLIF